MFRRGFTAASLGAVVGLAAATISGCRGADVAYDCEDYLALFNEIAEREGQIFSEAGDDPPFPVALVWSAAGLNELFGSSLDDDVPFAGDLVIGPSTLSFMPTSAPVIEIPAAGSTGCARCLILSLEFDVDLVTAGQPVTSGDGTVSLLVPIKIADDPDVPAGEAPSVELIAEYGTLRVLDLQLSAFGLDSDEHPAWEGAMQIKMEEQLRESYGDKTLLRLDSWTLGNGDIILAGRELQVSPEKGTVALVMDTNLPRVVSGFDPLETLPAGVEMALRIAPELMLGISRRLMTEGDIPRRYDENGDPDDEGIYGVTLESLVGNEFGNPRLDFVFKLWRTADGYCGNATIEMALDLSFNDDGIIVEPGQFKVVEGQGSGAVAAQDAELVKENESVIEYFRDELTNELELSMNYDSFEVEGKLLYIDTIGFRVTQDMVENHLDMLVLAP